MNGNYTSGADLFADWKGDVTSGKPPVVFPVAPPEHPLSTMEVGPGQVVLLGAPPGGGKSALVMQMAFDAVHLSPTLKALVCNVEMGAAALLNRQLARLAELPHRLVRKRLLTADHAVPLARGMEDIERRLKRVAFVRPPFDLANVAVSADEFGADLIVLDYLQRIGPPKQYADKRLSLNAAMDTVRAMADCGCAVVVVSAVGRQRNEHGKSGYDGLTLASFRESSELEYGADSAYLLVREADSADAVLKCVKSRHGEAEDIPLRFTSDYQRFDPPSDGKLSAAVRGVWGEADEGGDW